MSFKTKLRTPKKSSFLHRPQQGLIGDIRPFVKQAVRDMVRIKLHEMGDDIETAAMDVVEEKVEMMISKGLRGKKGDTIVGAPGEDSVVPGPPGKASFVPGPKGDPGTDGATPIAGVDFDIPKDGEDADEKSIIKTVLEKIPSTKKFKDIVKKLVSPKEIARSLEKLSGKEQLDYYSLKNLPDIPSVYAKKGRTLHRGGQGLAVFSVDLSSQTDGSTKSFTIPPFTRVIMLISSDFPTILRPTVDFNASGTTLTITDEVDAPTDGSTLILSYAK